MKIMARLSVTFAFGMLLGITGVVGYNASSVRYSSCGIFICKCGLYCRERTFYLFIALQCIGFVLLIGLVNLIVSFSLTLWVALRSLNAEIDSWWPIWHEVCQIVKNAH